MVKVSENEGHCIVPKSKEVCAKSSYDSLLNTAEIKARISGIKRRVR